MVYFIIISGKASVLAPLTVKQCIIIHMKCNRQTYWRPCMYTEELGVPCESFSHATETGQISLILWAYIGTSQSTHISIYGYIITSGLREAIEWFSWNNSLHIDHYSKKNPYSNLTVKKYAVVPIKNQVLPND